MANKSSSKSLISKASPHTIKKFELIEEYVKSWAQKLMLNNFCNTLVFIDCMCNSGIYINDETGQQTEGTPVRVAKVLLDVARNYPGKNIEMYLNDIDPLRVEEIKKYTEAIRPSRIRWRCSQQTQFPFAGNNSSSPRKWRKRI